MINLQLNFKGIQYTFIHSSMLSKRISYITFVFLRIFFIKDTLLVNLGNSNSSLSCKPDRVHSEKKKVCLVAYLLSSAQYQIWQKSFPLRVFFFIAVTQRRQRSVACASHMQHSLPIAHDHTCPCPYIASHVCSVADAASPMQRRRCSREHA